MSAKVAGSSPNTYALASTIAVLSSRESLETLFLTVQAAVRAAIAPAVVDVVVNGNLQLAQQIATRINDVDARANQGTTAIRVWHVSCGDKAHAWNRYLHEIWPGSEVAFFVDGYARIRPDACALLRDGMIANPDTLAGSGVPMSGRTAARLRQQMLDEGGIHGNFWAVKGPVMAELKAKAYRLPLGLYRLDPTVAAALNFALNPAQNEWNPRRIFVHGEATWEVDEKAWWRWGELRAQYKRLLRQGQGDLENRAVRNFLAIRKLPPEGMPETVAEFVLTWASQNPGELRRLLFTNPLALHALRKLRDRRDWSSKDQPVTLLGQKPSA